MFVINHDSDSVDDDLHEQLYFEYPKKENAEEERHTVT